MNKLIIDIDFIRSCLLKAGSERTRRILEADLQKLEEERDQIMRDFAAHLKELRREKGYNLWTGSHQMTRKEELEMYWMEQSAENRKRCKRKRW